MANKITVTSAGTVINANVTSDTTRYYSDKSKEWAISDKLIDNEDYSSKYYANESKKQADISTAKTTEVVESGNTAVTNIESAKNNAITDITNQESVSVKNVNAAGATQVANVNSAGATQVNLAKEQVTLATNQANIATNKASEVVASGKTALANITTAKNNAITSITNQETTSKNNVIATGNKQVERVNLTGVDNRTPIFSKSEVGTNEGVYQNVYDLKHSTFDKSKFTVVGSPTITDDGIASGFSSGNGINSTLVLTPKSGFRIKQKFTLGTNISTNQTTFGLSRSGTNRFILELRFISGGGTHLLYSAGETSHNSFSWTQIELPRVAEGSYDVDIITNGTEITAKINGVEKSANDFFIATSNMLRIGAGTTSSGDNPFLGSTDLKQFSITVDGKEVFNGNKTGLDVINGIEIPYTLSKTGSKIVDVAYRDRVIDLYEQEGKAGYYTIDETNKNFTLPIGEIYGMIEAKADKITVEESLATKADVTTPSIQAPYLKDTYVNGTSGYNIWSNGYCEQWGYLSGQNTATITLLKTMANTDYYINMAIRGKQGEFPTSPEGNQRVAPVSTSKIFVATNTASWCYGTYWKVCGYLAEGEY